MIADLNTPSLSMRETHFLQSDKESETLHSSIFIINVPYGMFKLDRKIMCLF